MNKTKIPQLTLLIIISNLRVNGKGICVSMSVSVLKCVRCGACVRCGVCGHLYYYTGFMEASVGHMAVVVAAVVVTLLAFCNLV